MPQFPLTGLGVATDVDGDGSAASAAGEVNTRAIVEASALASRGLAL
jgi:hypothetical protein